MSECVHGLEVSTCATCSPKPDEMIGARRRGAAGGDSLTGFFELLGAPLRNSRWSWGAVRERDGVVFLRVWDDQVELIDGVRVVLVYKHIEGYRSPGIPERLRQLDLVREGAICFLVFCSADDPNHEPRSIAAFNVRYLNRGGRVIVSGGDTWIEVGDSVLADEVMRSPNGAGD
jgi:hypothetical protein